MKLHEYQAKQLLSQYGVKSPKGIVVRDLKEAKEAIDDFGSNCVIKAQVHSGGRGKAGGIKLPSNREEAIKPVDQMLAMKLITKQTGPEGLPVTSILIEEKIAIHREIYLSMSIDNSLGKVVILTCSSGGMDIEEIAESRPEEIQKVYVDPSCGFQGFQARAIAFGLSLNSKIVKEAEIFIMGLVKAFHDCDAAMIEINPLVITDEEELLAGDAKVTIDDNATFRQPDLMKYRDPQQEPEIEVLAHENGIDNYVKLDGNIGCLVNGAGLAMATMDAIKFEGGDPANFLDIGTANDQKAVVAALKLIGDDPNVEAVLINIFGPF